MVWNRLSQVFAGTGTLKNVILKPVCITIIAYIHTYIHTHTYIYINICIYIYICKHQLGQPPPPVPDRYLEMAKWTADAGKSSGTRSRPAWPCSGAAAASSHASWECWRWLQQSFGGTDDIGRWKGVNLLKHKGQMPQVLGFIVVMCNKKTYARMIFLILNVCFVCTSEFSYMVHHGTWYDLLKTDSNGMGHVPSGPAEWTLDVLNVGAGRIAYRGDPPENPTEMEVYSWNHHLTGWWFGTFFIFAYIGKFIIPID